jgi:hypothetical protein
MSTSRCGYCSEVGHNIRGCRSVRIGGCISRFNAATCVSATKAFYTVSNESKADVRMICARAGVHNLSGSKVDLVKELMNLRNPGIVGPWNTAMESAELNALIAAESNRRRAVEEVRRERNIQARENDIAMRERDRMLRIQDYNLRRAEEEWMRNPVAMLVRMSTDELINLVNILGVEAISMDRRHLMLAILNRAGPEPVQVPAVVEAVDGAIEVLIQGRILGGAVKVSIIVKKQEDVCGCSICQEDEVEEGERVKLSCGHNFCAVCVSKCFESRSLNNNCALCRVPMLSMEVNDSACAEKIRASLLRAQVRAQM